MFFDAEVIGPWVYQRVGGYYVPGSAAAIGRIQDGRITGGILYEDFNGANVVCHIASEGRLWLNKQFLWMIFDYPFRQLGAQRMTAPIVSANTAAIRFVEKLGFEREAILHGAHPDGDIFIYRMMATACRWLRD
ncbi:GNAT family N-acetyltransferase [Bordetella bronchiseptica]|uniref:GNAT family N-acetyltransferase n=1 Tax=Bordetella bronchiseptica TaxID=518 RepID=UPI0013795307|nr:GNAT family protein [Bordetella bronchiseptica]